MENSEMLFINKTRQERQIAVVGIGCWYPGARGPRELWENIVARRREFRRMPDCRLPLAEYHDADRTVPDKTYGRLGGVIDGFRFDWAARRIPQATAACTDIVQWLALEVASQAIADAGLVPETMSRERTGVIVGNTLTGEQTRSQSLRLRWPFVRKTLLAAAKSRGLGQAAALELAATMEEVYKSAFAPVTEDTLAGGLSNTVAGRICNAFDLHGGGYTVDGACSSSLLAICTAADKLVSGDLDLALAGGVDVSLDTFELIGFAKTGALTTDEMRVYDKRANGFIPGEGCGFVLLKRLEDARAAGNQILAVLKGWGVSSDGKGGLTAPSRDGQARAIKRAYARAGYGPHDLDFIEGHGTGTRVGDRVEIEAIAKALDSDAPSHRARKVGLTSLKSIIGHTKAAAGIGAFIKAVMAVNRRVVPPTAGCHQPNDSFVTTAAGLHPVLQGRIAPSDETLRAGISAMGFGGINAHVTVESGDQPATRFASAIQERALLVSAQECEVFPLAAQSISELCDDLKTLAQLAEPISLGDLTDLAAKLAEELPADGAARAVIVAGTPAELQARCLELTNRLNDQPPGPGEIIAGNHKEYLAGFQMETARIGFVFPGQGSQHLGMARVLFERHEWAQELAAKTDRWLAEVGATPISDLVFGRTEHLSEEERLHRQACLMQTEMAQPAIVLASMIWLRHLKNLGLAPSVIAGHSLGELTAFFAAGAIDEETVIKLAALRGRAMAAPPSKPGCMAALGCGKEEAEAILKGITGYVAIANLNSPRQTVVSGVRDAVDEVVAQANGLGVSAKLLPVSNAFHCDLVLEAAAILKHSASVEGRIEKLAAILIAGADGREVEPGLELRSHFASQVLAPVDFVATASALADRCDLLVEVGPGKALSGLVEETAAVPCLPVASRPGVDKDLFIALGYAWVVGAPAQWSALYENRLVRSFVRAGEREFIENPCERPLAIPKENPLSAFGSFEGRMTKETNYPPEKVAEYLARRGSFLAAVVRADLACEGVAPVVPESPKPLELPPFVPPVERPIRENAQGAHGESDIEGVLLNLVVARTGFERNSISSQSRLLDDLNLDSIKAAELVAQAAKQFHIAGKVDPSQLANATLAEIASALRSAGAGPAPAKLEAPLEIPATQEWVREFVVEYRTAPLAS